jgi:DNA-binding FadR family transcriptional regulator
VSLYGRDTPAYLLLAEDLARRIAAGEFEPSGRLPSAPRLQADYDVSSTVVRDALRRLRALGATYAQTSRGTRVRRPLPGRVRDMTVPDPVVAAVVARLAERGVVVDDVVDEVTVRLPTPAEARPATPAVTSGN